MLLLLLVLCSGVHGLVVEVDQEVYQAEENQNITMEWTFYPVRPNASRDSVSVVCFRRIGLTVSVLYRVHNGVKLAEDEEFAGRVRGDEDLLGRGRVRLQVSSLGTEDGGDFTCQVKTEDGRAAQRCRLKVAPLLAVSAAQPYYTAEENQNLTLEWAFKTRGNISWNDVFAACFHANGYRVSVLYRAREGTRVPEAEDKEFAGRVESDDDVLRDGLIRLRLSSLRTDDGGLYTCGVTTEDGFDMAECWLAVTAFKGKQKDSANTPWGWILFLCILTVPVLLSVCYRLVVCCRRPTGDY